MAGFVATAVVFVDARSRSRAGRRMDHAMIDANRICPPDFAEHCLFGLRGAAGEAPRISDAAARAAWRQRQLADLAMTEEEWARRYAESNR